MSLLKFKPGVVVPKVCIIAAAVVNAANVLDLAEDMVVTSGTDSSHKIGSLHYVDRALDFRTRTLSPGDRQILAKAVKRRLGRDYDVVLESDHLHVEYDPKD